MGNTMEINYATSAGGFIGIEILDENNERLINGLRYSSEKIIGDEIAGKVKWQKSLDLASIEGKIIRLRITMKEADLYSFKFNN